MDNLSKVSFRKKLIGGIFSIILVSSSMLFISDFKIKDVYKKIESAVSKDSNIEKKEEIPKKEKLEDVKKEVPKKKDEKETLEDSKYDWKDNEFIEGYTIKKGEKVEVSVNNPKPFAYIYKELPIYYFEGKLPNALTITFENIDESISHISFFIEGDRKYLLNNGKYEYDMMYQEKIGEYVKGKNKYTTGNSLVNLTFDLTKPLKKIENNMSNGLRLVMFIESDGKYKGKYDGKGKMKIYHCEMISIKK